MYSKHCRKHIRELDAKGLIDKPMKDWPAMGQLFVVCPACGNKRCPKASDCSYACTNSNESGQPGSEYT